MSTLFEEASGGGDNRKWLIKDGKYVGDFRIGSLRDGNIRVNLGRYITVQSTNINTDKFTKLFIYGKDYGANQSHQGITIKFQNLFVIWKLRKGDADYNESNTTSIGTGMNVPINTTAPIVFKGDEQGGYITITDMFLDE